MTGSVALAAVFALTLAAAWLFRRSTRRLSPVSYLENVTVSRQWLMQHQADD